MSEAMSVGALRLAVIALLAVAAPVFGRRFHTRGEPAVRPHHSSRPVEFHMPPYQPKENDAYVCTGIKVSDLAGTDATVWVTQYRALSDADTAHHMLLFQCDDLTPQQRAAGKWECGHHGVCQNSQVMYAWAKNAPATKLPDDVGFKIGGTTQHKYLVLQIHYAHPLPAPDTSGVELMVSEKPQKYQAGIYLLLDGSVVIPPNTPVTHADVNCQFNGENTLTAFAYRVHAHKLGKVITGYRYNTQNQTLVEMARGNPQWPQAFYPMKHPIDIHPGDLVHARCTFDSTGRNRTTRIGATSADEMCNLYVMYYTDAEKGRSAFACMGENVPELTDALPANSDQPLPPNPLLEEHAKHTHKEDMTKTLQYNVAATGSSAGAADMQSEQQPEQPELQPIGTVLNPDDYEPGRIAKALGGVQFVHNWGGSAHTFGQAVAVSVDLSGNVVVFHRASRAWSGGSFNGNRLRDTSSPIPENTIVYLRNDTGEIVFQMGARFFYMPHGLTIDHEDNVWCTDVGMHQVFKFSPRGGDGTPQLTLGTKFEPGSDDYHFCKPTSVAVMRDGSFFVADGYCNTRILKFGPGGGRPVRTVGRASSSLLGRPPALDEFNIPHSLTLLEDRNMICTADRENGRVVCFRASDLSATDVTINWQRSRIYGLAYSPRDGGALFVVNGPNYAGNKVQGYVVSVTSKSVTSTFSPDGNGLSNPHDVAVSRDGSAVYVVELNPRKVWRFNVDGPHTAQKKSNVQTSAAAGVAGGVQDPTVEFVKSPDAAGDDSAAPSLSGHAKLAMAALFGVPVVLFVVIMAVLRLRKRNQRRRFFLHNLNDGPGHRKTLDSLLGTKSRQGFEPLATQDLDDDSDSDVEEFIAKIKSRT
ncbi:peptidyl-glycine alpha-amidating monooxygenase-like isoform X4 [Amphibalanus amphitrite]|uniref:peptidyl-glycine alpha-amidating monooxygenase-like isoform X4 n=1 Tax=Amphibalanus amphitrite TaxID=1232801 RepID=UPI001C921954|nr:peptidyl-glycine alpha-amidating monooxygenase-like isoform X4 [Amphibalanus amphitrite]